MKDYIILDEMPELAQDFLKHIISIKKYSKTTTKEYFYDLRIFFKFIKVKKLKLNISMSIIKINDLDLSFIESINENDLTDYIFYLTNQDLNSLTILRKISSLKSFFKYLTFKRRLLKINPAAELETPKLPKRLPKYLTLDESKALLHSIDGEFKERDFAIITLFLNCGLRLSELIKININDVNKDVLNIVGKGNKERQVYLNNACKSAISSYILVRPKNNLKDRDALFITKRGTRISSRSIELMVKKYLKSSDLDSKKFSPHKLRHTAATLMHKYGNVDIKSLQQILGHESIKTTEIYTHIDNEDVKIALDKNPLNNI